MQLLTELLNLQSHDDELFLVEDLHKLRELGLGRMVNAFKQSFAQAGHGSTARLTKTNVGDKLQSRATGIGPTSEAIEVGPVRNWPRVKRELIKHGQEVAGLLFKVDEKPVSLVVMGPGWSLNNLKSVLGQAWDFTNLSASDEEIETVLGSLRTSKQDKADKSEDKKKHMKIREYQGRAQDLAQVIEFVKKGVEAFGNRFHLSIITKEKKEADKQPEKLRAGMTKSARAADTEESDREYLAQRAAKKAVK